MSLITDPLVGPRLSWTSPHPWTAGQPLRVARTIMRCSSIRRGLTPLYLPKPSHITRPPELPSRARISRALLFRRPSRLSLQDTRYNVGLSSGPRHPAPRISPSSHYCTIHSPRPRPLSPQQRPPLSTPPTTHRAVSSLCFRPLPLAYPLRHHAHDPICPLHAPNSASRSRTRHTRSPLTLQRRLVLF